MLQIRPSNHGVLLVLGEYLVESFAQLMQRDVRLRLQYSHAKVGEHAHNSAHVRSFACFRPKHKPRVWSALVGGRAEHCGAVTAIGHHDGATAAVSGPQREQVADLQRGDQIARRQGNSSCSCNCCRHSTATTCALRIAQQDGWVVWWTRAVPMAVAEQDQLLRCGGHEIANPLAPLRGGRIAVMKNLESWASIRLCLSLNHHLAEQHGVG